MTLNFPGIVPPVKMWGCEEVLCAARVMVREEGRM